MGVQTEVGSQELGVEAEAVVRIGVNTELKMRGRDQQAEKDGSPAEAADCLLPPHFWKEWKRRDDQVRSQGRMWRETPDVGTWTDGKVTPPHTHSSWDLGLGSQARQGMVTVSPAGTWLLCVSSARCRGNKLLLGQQAWLPPHPKRSQALL